MRNGMSCTSSPYIVSQRDSPTEIGLRPHRSQACFLENNKEASAKDTMTPTIAAYREAV
jgi:hypothetical protein